MIGREGLGFLLLRAVGASSAQLAVPPRRCDVACAAAHPRDGPAGTLRARDRGIARQPCHGGRPTARVPRRRARAGAELGRHGPRCAGIGTESPRAGRGCVWRLRP
eukprot:2439362-Pyramimonas_sp.AAC.1